MSCEEGKVVRKIPCAVYSRIVGYLAPLKNWNEAMREQFKDRKTFNVDATTKDFDYAKHGTVKTFENE